MLEILKEKAKLGVEVRLMYDGMGCLGTLPRNYPDELEKMGIKSLEKTQHLKVDSVSAEYSCI